jgi:hypothetical protein
LQFSKPFFKGVKIALIQIVKDNVVRGKWLDLLQIITSFCEWLQMPVAIALPRISLLVKKLAKIDADISN